MYLALNNLTGMKGVKFAYGVSKNLAKLKGHAEAMDKAKEVSEEFMNYENARIEIVEKHAEKDERGRAVKTSFTDDRGIAREEYFVKDEKALEKAVDPLKKKNKKVIEDRDTQLKDFNKLLKEEATEVPEFHKIKLSEVPAEITTDQMHGIMAIIEEDGK